jgi:peptide deformylase
MPRTLQCGASRAVVTAATLYIDMSLIPILELPHPHLRKVAAPLAPGRTADPAFQRLVDDMFETMYAAPGIGLAATQVDAHERFMIVDVTEEHEQPLVFVNPVIRSRSKELRVHQEGCLSIPGIFADVTRADGIAVEALDRHGTPFVLEVDGLLATCIQHEVDHLDGKLFIDHLSSLKRDRALKKYDKLRRQGDAA